MGGLAVAARPRRGSFNSPSAWNAARSTICRSLGHSLSAEETISVLSGNGKRGELHQRYREGQEDQLGALGLVVNVIILWNTLYINAALEQLASEGHPVRPEDVARLSPLVFDHINLLGRYAFSVPEAVQRGELRPLRTANDLLNEAV